LNYTRGSQAPVSGSAEQAAPVKGHPTAVPAVF